MELGGQGWGKLLYINWEMVPRMRIGTWSEGLEETKVGGWRLEILIQKVWGRIGNSGFFSFLII